MKKIALVLWNGDIGGAEVLSLQLATAFQVLGAEPTMLFVTDPDPLRERVQRAGIPFRNLGFRRGRDVLRHPRLYGDAVSGLGQDGALLLQTGFMGAALRLGGYRGPIVAVEHGPVNFRPGYSKLRKAFSGIDRRLGAYADDVEVGVSDYLVDQMRQQPHSRRLVRIYNGIDPDPYAPQAGEGHDDTDVAIGFMGRLVEGKGVDHLIRAVALSRRRVGVTLTIAGDGPERKRLEALGRDAGIEAFVSFVGVVRDFSSFWSGCSIASVPTAELNEGFSLVTLEAMACGKPVVASRNGAIPELLLNGKTGTLVPPGDPERLADALVSYAESRELRDEHGSAARARAIDRFNIRDSAIGYLNLFGDLGS